MFNSKYKVLWFGHEIKLFIILSQCYLQKLEHKYMFVYKIS